jgi:hypothetical protein
VRNGPLNLPGAIRDIRLVISKGINACIFSGGTDRCRLKARAMTRDLQTAIRTAEALRFIRAS